MELREAVRYCLYENTLNELKISDVSVNFDFDDTLKGMLTDVSLKGIGMEIRNINNYQIERLKELDNYFIKLNFNREELLLGVKNAWNKVFIENGKMILRGGVFIDIISLDDRLRLYGIIEKLRELL